jgi:hypothetical protein
LKHTSPYRKVTIRRRKPSVSQFQQPRTSLSRSHLHSYSLPSGCFWDIYQQPTPRRRFCSKWLRVSYQSPLFTSNPVAHLTLSSLFRTYLPDYFNGDPITEAMYHAPGFTSADWFKNHSSEVTRPPLDAVMKGLKERGVTEFGAVGYCEHCFSPQPPD